MKFAASCNLHFQRTAQSQPSSDSLSSLNLHFRLQVDKKLLIILRDGRKLIGWLRTKWVQVGECIVVAFICAPCVHPSQFSDDAIAWVPDDLRCCYWFCFSPGNFISRSFAFVVMKVIVYGNCLSRTFDQFANLLVEHVVERHIIFEEPQCSAQIDRLGNVQVPLKPSLSCWSSVLPTLLCFEHSLSEPAPEVPLQELKLWKIDLYSDANTSGAGPRRDGSFDREEGPLGKVAEWVQDVIEWLNDRVSGLAIEWMNEQTNEWMNEWMKWITWIKWNDMIWNEMNKWMNGWMNGWMDQSINESMNQMNEWMNERIKWMKSRKDGICF